MKFSLSNYRRIYRIAAIFCVSVFVFFFSISCSQASVSDKVKPIPGGEPEKPIPGGEPEKPVVVPSASIVLADMRTTNLIVKGDAMVNEVLAEYAPVASFYGNQIFKDLVNVKFNPGLGANFSLANSIIGNYIDNTPSGAIVAVPVTDDSEIIGNGVVVTPGMFGPIVDDLGNSIKTNALDAKVAIGYLTTELDSINSNIEKVEYGISKFKDSAKAITVFNEKYKTGLSSVTTILNNESLSRFVNSTAATLSKVQGGITQLTTVLGKCGPVLNTICSVVDMFCGGSEKISSGEAEILAQMQAQFDKVFAQLDTIQSAIGTVDDHLLDLGYTLSSQDYKAVRYEIDGFRSALPDYIDVDKDKTQLIDKAGAVNLVLRGKIATMASVALDKRAAYLLKLKNYKGQDATLLALQKELVAEYTASFVANVDVKQVYRKASPVKKGSYSYSDYVTIANPAIYLPTELEYLQYLSSTMEWSYTVLDILAPSLEWKHERYSALAEYYLLNVIAPLRSDLISKMAAQTIAFNSIIASIDTKRSALNSVLAAQPRYVFSPKLSYTQYYGSSIPLFGIQVPGECVYKGNKYWRNDRLAISTDGTIDIAGWKAHGYPTGGTSYHSGLNGYNLPSLVSCRTADGILSIGPENTSGAFQIMNADGNTGWDYPKETIKVGVDTDAYWNGVKAIVKADYIQRSTDMLHYAATLAAMELATKAWIID